MYVELSNYLFEDRPLTFFKILFSHNYSKWLQHKIFEKKKYMIIFIVIIF